VILLFNNGLKKLIYLNTVIYTKHADMNNRLIQFTCKAGRKNILIFKNKRTFIKYAKYDQITLKFNSTESFMEILSI
jgi:hypothetical protein